MRRAEGRQALKRPGDDYCANPFVIAVWCGVRGLRVTVQDIVLRGERSGAKGRLVVGRSGIPPTSLGVCHSVKRDTETTSKFGIPA